MKRCRGCQIEKDEDEFYNYKERRFARCKGCFSENWARTIVNVSRRSDKRYGREQESEQYITAEFLTAMAVELKTCYYCDCEVKYGAGINRKTNKDALHFDRKDSTKAHFMSNVVLSCMACNLRAGSLPFDMKVYSGAGRWDALGLGYCFDHSHGASDNHVLPMERFTEKGLKRGACKECNRRNAKTWQKNNAERVKVRNAQAYLRKKARKDSIL